MKRVFLRVAVALAVLFPPVALAEYAESVLLTFNDADGAHPNGRLIADSAGALYGVTNIGGPAHAGLAFRLSPPAAGSTVWTRFLLYRFAGFAGYPSAGFLLDSTGALFGTASGVPFDSPHANFTGGMVFALRPQSSPYPYLDPIYTFQTPDYFAHPYSDLIMDKSGALYGTQSGSATRSVTGVFKLVRDGAGMWQKTIIFRIPPFGGLSGLVADSSGSLYFMSDNGEVYRVSPTAGGTGWSGAVLATIQGGDFNVTAASLVVGRDGALYGTTPVGGSHFEGVVFRLTPPADGQTAWTETDLHSFGEGKSGKFPFASLILDAYGVLYGTTANGGDHGYGTAFKLSPPAVGQTDWTATTLHSFAGGHDGAEPRAPLLAGPDGVLYGTTFRGGAFDYGTVFKLTP